VDPNALAGFVLLLVSQKMRASKNIPNVLSGALVALCVIVLFWFKDESAGWAVFLNKSWWWSAGTWAFVILGGGRAAADLGLLPKTNHQ
jgi:hypothetical protein